MARAMEAGVSLQAKTKLTADEQRVFDAYRRWGYLAAELDPLGFLPPELHPELETESPTAAEARRVYCGTIGAEFMHIADPARRRWLAERLEGAAPAVDQRFMLERLIRAELFEQVLQARYLGTKRFSLEGNVALIPLLDEVLEGHGRSLLRAAAPRTHRRRPPRPLG